MKDEKEDAMMTTIEDDDDESEIDDLDEDGEKCR